MVRDFYDVAIVGAGPAGGMAAVALAASGLSVVLLERQTLPRPKACGGAMPASARALLDWDISPLVEAEIAEQRYLCGGRESRAANAGAPMLLVDRAAFDRYIVARAHVLAEGRLDLVEGQSVRDAQEDDAEVVLTTRQGLTVRARYVIAADGATSSVARALGLFRPSGGAAVDVEIRVTPAAFAREGWRSTFDLDCVRDGYGWVFPKRDRLSCGIGIWRQPSDLKPRVKRFLDGAFGSDEILAAEYRAHPVPVFPGHRPSASRRVCLVGDAARLVDPVVGEGIVYAFESGRLAADVVALLCGATPASGGTGQIVGRPEYGPRLRVAIAEHEDCGAYGAILRLTLARTLNLKRMGSGSFFERGGAFYTDTPTL